MIIWGDAKLRGLPVVPSLRMKKDGKFQISVGYLEKPFHAHMHAIVINENEAMIVKKIREGYIGGLRGRKGTGILYL